MPRKGSKTKRTSKRRTSRGKRSSGKRSSHKRNTSKNRMTWEAFLKHKDSRKVLKDAWNHKNPQKHFGQTVKRLHRKYSSNKKK